jgi:hypothetical protein
MRARRIVWKDQVECGGEEMSQYGVTQQQTRHQFTDHGSLPDTTHQVSQQPRGENQQRELSEKI